MAWESWRNNRKEDEYHPNFASRARALKRRKKYTCEKCGAKRGETRLNKSGKPYKVMVAAAHVNHDPENPKAKLKILCQVCHLEHDVFQHVRSKRQKEYEKQIQAGQLVLPLKFKDRPRKQRKKDR